MCPTGNWRRRTARQCTIITTSKLRSLFELGKLGVPRPSTSTECIHLHRKREAFAGTCLAAQM